MLHVLRLFGGNGITATQNSNIVSPNVIYFNAGGYFVKAGVTSNAGDFALDWNLLHLQIVGNFIQISAPIQREELSTHLQAQSKWTDGEPEKFFVL